MVLEPYAVIATIVSAISVASLIILMILLHKAKLNGYTLIIWSLALSTLIYTCSFFWLFTYRTDGGDGPFLYFNVFGDALQSCWTVFLSFALFRITSSLENVRITVEYPYYLALDIFVGLFFLIFLSAECGALCTKASYAYTTFYWYRMITVIISFALYAFANYYKSRLHIHVTSGKITQFQADGIKQLVTRMRSYNLVQAVMRVGTIWFNYNQVSIRYEPAHYLDVCTAPSCGLGYFLVYLYVQPGATAALIRLFGIQCKSQNKEFDDDSSTTDNSNLNRESIVDIIDEEELIDKLPTRTVSGRITSMRFISRMDAAAAVSATTADIEMRENPITSSSEADTKDNNN